MSPQNKTLLVIGAGPGIGRSVTTLFASKAYANVALFARGADGLVSEKKAVEESVGANVKVKTYQVDVADPEALRKALEESDADFGKPDCVFYNAARVQPSELLTHDLKEIEYDFKINVSGLYTVSQHYIPHLLDLTKTDSEARPALLITSSCLPLHPVPQFFALSLVKAAQRNMAQSMHMTYASQGVAVGLINVGGPVAPDHPTRNPSNIAAKSWEWFSGLKEKPSFEVLIE
ncbi:hypothetical protein BJ166DRAFT_526584 [Pestalotiopsis sp. NC0098]|nr:hypothetical protein BJ166DRAFT_526584 [Pestalotiopsis sp. NC0098]